MISFNRRPHLLSSEASETSMRSDRLLRGMHKVYSHDLPNQIVVFQSLLHFLMEEADRLTREGQEQVQRLQAVTHRFSEMIRFLKEMGKLNGYVARLEKIPLPLIARELQGTLKQQFPDKPFAFDWHWATPTISVDYPTFFHAVTEIVASLTTARKSYRLQASSETTGNQVALHFLVENGVLLDENNLHLAASRLGAASFAERRDVVLVREWLAISEATLDWSIQNNGGNRFTILIPNR
jgi:light-regulated signal transduction histidine kinase (bacteriophytochrome)